MLFSFIWIWSFPCLCFLSEHWRFLVFSILIFIFLCLPNDFACYFVYFVHVISIDMFVTSLLASRFLLYQEFSVTWDFFFLSMFRAVYSINVVITGSWIVWYLLYMVLKLFDICRWDPDQFSIFLIILYLFLHWSICILTLTIVSSFRNVTSLNIYF